VLTLLWVEPGKGGLQVERDSEWVDAPPVPGAFVVNIGELLEHATQGYLTATNHRVVSPKHPDDRISVPFFFNPALDARLPVIDLPADLAARSPGRDAGSGQPDPRASTGECAQVTAARAPRRRGDPPRRPRGG
jgi:isopenicillin N synthase-like dioxygenase